MSLPSALFRICFWILSSTFALAGPLDTWRQVSPLPSGENILDVTYLNGKFLASAGLDGVLASVDGISWERRLLAPGSATVYRATSVARGTNIYVAIGYEGQAFSSVDAIDWTPRWSGVTVPLQSVAYGKGIFAAVGGNGTGRAILTSNDGITWTVQRLSDEATLSKVIFNDNQFIAVGNSGTVVASSDGRTWRQTATLGKERVSSIAIGNGRLVAASSKIYTSTNSSTWITNAPALQSTFPIVVFGGGRFLVLDGSRVWISTDGLAWTVEAAPTLFGIGAAAYGNGQFVAVGNEGFVATSGDGLTWIVRHNGPNVLFDQVAAGNGVVLATGDGSIQIGPNEFQQTSLLLKSRDGMNWTPAGTDSEYRAVGIGFANRQFIIFARDNRNPAAVFVLTSADGSTWARNDIASSGAALRIIYANGQYLAVGGGIFNSADGQHWNVQPQVSINTLTGVAYGNGRYVAVGVEGGAFVSSNGLAWTPRPTGSHWLTDIAFAKGVFVAVGNDYDTTANSASLRLRGQLFTSIDGETWVRQVKPSGPGADDDLNRIIYAAGWFVAVSSGGAVLTSPDGIQWTSRRSATRHSLASVAYSEGTFIAVGQGGTTVVSGNVLGTSLTSPSARGSGMSFLVTGQPGQLHRIQSATGLKTADWTDIGTLTNETGSVLFTDPGSSRIGTRFYRAVTME